MSGGVRPGAIAIAALTPAQSVCIFGWNIFVTNVPRPVWPAKFWRPSTVRWRIEVIFKAWKSHLGLRQLNCRSANLLRLSV